jgi:hypothetical protein
VKATARRRALIAGHTESDASPDRGAQENQGHKLRTYILGPGLAEPFEIGARLMAILAFPSAAEEDAMFKAADALCANNVRVSCEAIPGRAAGLREIFADYAAIDDKESRRRLRTFRRRLHDRMIASRMSLGFLEQGFTKIEPRLPASMARLSLNELSNLVLSQSRESVAENVEKRAWRETLPVVHIAAAYQWVTRTFGGADAAYGVELQDLDFHRLVIATAEIHERLVLADRRFGIAPDRLVRLRWVE